MAANARRFLSRIARNLRTAETFPGLALPSLARLARLCHGGAAEKLTDAACGGAPLAIAVGRWGARTTDNHFPKTWRRFG